MTALLQPLQRYFSAFYQWLKHGRRVGTYSIFAGLGVIFLCWLAGYHEPFMPQTPHPDKLPKGWEPPPNWAYVVIYLLSYMRLAVLVGGVVYHIVIFRAYPKVEKMIKPTWMVSIFVMIWAVASQFYGRWEVAHLSYSGAVFSNVAFFVQVMLLCGLLLTPPLMLTYYSRCKIMERYLMKSFLQPLIFCFIAFCTLWIVMDLLDNLADFQENKINKVQIAYFYLKLVPFIYVTVAPITLLLSTLYVLGRMSRSNELISMLGAGKSMLEVLRPIYITGLFASFLSMAANYHWAPVSAGNKEKLVEGVKERMNQNIMLMGLMYRNHEDRRTWFVGLVPSDLRTDRMRRIEIRQEDEQGKLVKSWFSKSAFWWPDTKTWSLYSGVETTYENGQVVSIQNFESSQSGAVRRDLEGWSETPWILLSGSLTPDYLGVPDLLSYLKANEAYSSRKLAPYKTHFFYRFAQPWHCMIVVMFAAPLAVVFSRRGLVGGMASAVLFFFVLMFLDNLFLNLGKGQHLYPFFAAWLPHLLLGAVGVYLFQMRSQNRDLPQLSLKGLWSLPAKVQDLFRAKSARPA
jgi:lipopolysaccharide export system permease protein